MKPIWSVAAIAVSLAGLAGPVLAQNVAAGEKVFRKCAACHNVGDDAGNSVGPVLNNVLGRKAGIYDGYRYSKTLLAAGEAGLVWDADKIAAYITDPRDFMKNFLSDPKAKPKMTFKLKKQQDRLDVIAYLQSFSDPPSAEADGTTKAATDRPVDAAIVPADDKVCVRNASQHSHFFAAEGKGVERVTATLAPGDTLCATARGPGWSGVVSVYETATGFEGCSRLVRTGTVEDMRAYADFDRCAWGSNSPDTAQP
jgi:cytochrome c2